MKQLILLVSVLLLLLQISYAQNVGIGTNTPAYRLDVNGRMRVKANPVNNPNSTAGIWFDDYRDASDRVFAGMQDSIRWGLWGGGSGGAGWQFNFNAKNGYIGLGMTNQSGSARLQINDANGGQAQFYNNLSYRGTVRATDTTLEIASAGGSTLCIPTPCTPPPPQNLILQPAPSGFSFFVPGRVGIGVNSPNAKFHVGGNVMIGNGDPAAGYLLSVNGRVICTEARVQLAASWPDYVFHNGYRLPAISDLEKFIHANHHLPNMPSATEVEKEKGFDLGDMQRRLLEKVEELTLYVIQLKKENEQLQKRMEALEKK